MKDMPVSFWVIMAIWVICILILYINYDAIELAVKPVMDRLSQKDLLWLILIVILAKK